MDNDDDKIKLKLPTFERRRKNNADRERRRLKTEIIEAANAWFVEASEENEKRLRAAVEKHREGVKVA